MNRKPASVVAMPASAAARIGCAGADFLSGLTWDRYAAGIADIVAEHL